MTETAAEPGAISLRAVVSVLTRAGFPRSDAHRVPLTGDRRVAGFSAWRSASRDVPSAPVVCVSHFDAGQGDGVTEAECAASWSAHVRRARQMLPQYGAMLAVAGYEVTLRLAHEDPYLVAGAREETQP